MDMRRERTAPSPGAWWSRRGCHFAPTLVLAHPPRANAGPGIRFPRKPDEPPEPEKLPPPLPMLPCRGVVFCLKERVDKDPPHQDGAWKRTDACLVPVVQLPKSRGAITCPPDDVVVCAHTTYCRWPSKGSQSPFFAAVDPYRSVQLPPRTAGRLNELLGTPDCLETPATGIRLSRKGIPHQAQRESGLTGCSTLPVIQIRCLMPSRSL
jgi:hypothetical protein